MLASTQDLHEKIAELSNRVRELEDGLRSSHAMHSADTHPLLSEDLLRIKAPLQRENLSIATNGNPDEPGGDVVDSFGSLSISDTGRTNYFGQATSSWVRFHSPCAWRSIAYLPYSAATVLPAGEFQLLDCAPGPSAHLMTERRTEGSGPRAPALRTTQSATR